MLSVCSEQKLALICSVHSVSQSMTSEELELGNHRESICLIWLSLSALLSKVASLAFVFPSYVLFCCYCCEFENAR